MADRITYGGQAVVEGVMMRGPRFFAVACRRADGEIHLHSESVPAIFTRFGWAKWPFLRGVFALADALVLGMKSLVYSANLAAEDEAAGRKPPSPVDQLLLGPLLPLLGTAPGGSSAISGIAITASAAAGMLIGIGGFMLLPSVLAGLSLRWVGPESLWPRLLEGAVRVAMVLGYIALIGRMKSIERVFQYHGAEHKAINALELEGAADVDAAERASRIHPRCGTNFVLMVLLIKALVFAVLPFHGAVLPRLALRLAFLPVVASLSYELIRLAGRFRGVAPLQWLVAPGLWTQRLTTREPDRGMLEVAVASLRGVMEREQEPRPA